MACMDGRTVLQLVSLSVLCVPFCCRWAQDAVHLGRYGPEGELCSEIVAALVADFAFSMLVLLVTLHLVLCSLVCRQACDDRHHDKATVLSKNRST